MDMWDAQLTAPLGRLPWRKFFMLALSFLVAVFTILAILTPPAHAADTASWQNGDLNYQGHAYKGPTQTKSGDNYDLPDGTIIYRYLEAAIPQKIHILYFPSGSDPAKANSATNIVYTIGAGGGFSGKTDPQTVTIDTSTQQQATQNSSSSVKDTSSCQVTGGLAWIICPLTTTLASVTDWVFNVVVSYLDVQPLMTTSTGNVIMKTWDIMRNFANVVFVIAFIFIIYSQLTSMGISNYGIKKMLPRLIIAAVMVNISYWICAIGIDLSNITGHATYDLFLMLRNSIAGMQNVDGWQLVNWKTFVTFAMTGGGAAVGGIALWTSIATKLVAFDVTGVVLMLLPILVMVFLVILVVMLILAARQAIIALLVMVAPLAFVAYLLPNTEKWFEKWRETFIAMLVFFPAFSAIFGGSQLAGTAIIQTAGSNINMVILGLAVQVAPLALTPVVMKLSNGLLGRVAGMINNPRKGLVDRTRNWANERLDANRAYQMNKTRRMAASKRGLRPYQVMRRTALHHDNEHRMREGLKAVNEETANSLFSDSPDGLLLAKAQKSSSMLKDQVSNRVAEAVQAEVNMQGTELHARNLHLEASKLTLEGENEQTAALIKEYKSGLADTGGIAELEMLRGTMARATVRNASEMQRSQSAANMQQKLIADAFTGSSELDVLDGVAKDSLLRVAAGVDPYGYNRAQAKAEADLDKINREARDNTIQLLRIRAINQGETLKSYTKKIMDASNTGQAVDYSKDEIEAAYEQQAIEGNVLGFEVARGRFDVDQAMLSRVIARNEGNMKAKGGYHLQEDPDLAITAIQELHPELDEDQVKAMFDQKMAVAKINTFATSSAKNIAGFKVGYFLNTADNLKNILETANAATASIKDGVEPVVNKAELNKSLENMFYNIHNATVNRDLVSEMSDRNDSVEKMENILEESGVPLKTPADIMKRHATDQDIPPEGL